MAHNAEAFVRVSKTWLKKSISKSFWVTGIDKFIVPVVRFEKKSKLVSGAGVVFGSTGGSGA